MRLASNTTARAVSEWIGNTPDAKIPNAVRLRVFERYGGFCAVSGRKIMPADKWDCDHIIPLKDGGEHREGNLQPVLADFHHAKTAEENHTRGKVKRTRQKYLGIKRKSGPPMPGSKASRFKKRIDGTIEIRSGHD
ncbi:MAG TPA: HNH endonuclease [Aestuariivirga sp.]|nr:HNH endonuclease [Aestuariivirga sp.]